MLDTHRKNSPPKNIPRDKESLGLTHLNKHPLTGVNSQMESKKVKIYALIDPITKRTRYIGKTEVTLERRLMQHIGEKKSNTHRVAWIAGLAKKGKKPIIQLIDIIDISEWIEAEKYWIRFYKELHGDMLNLTGGGECGYGKKPRKPHTQEWKDKMSVIMKGNKHCLGYKHTDEYKKTRSELLKVMYADGRRTPIKNYKGKNVPVVQLTLKGELITEHESVTGAALNTGLKRTNITENLRGVTKSAGGYIFKRKTEYEVIKR